MTHRHLAEQKSVATNQLLMRPTRMGLRELLNDLFIRGAALARWMSKAAAAHAILNIENQIIAWAGSDSHRHSIQPKRAARLPGHNVVRAGSVAAYAQSSHDLPALVIKSKSASEHNHSSDRLAHERVIGLTKLLR